MNYAKEAFIPRKGTLKSFMKDKGRLWGTLPTWFTRHSNFAKNSSHSNKPLLKIHFLRKGNQVCLLFHKFVQSMSQSSLNKLVIHKSSKSDFRRFTQFFSLMDLNQAKRWECPECSKNFRTKQNFTNHLLTHDPNAKVKCKVRSQIQTLISKFQPSIPNFLWLHRFAGKFPKRPPH